MCQPRLGGPLAPLADVLLGQHLAQPRMLMTHVFPRFLLSASACLLDRQGQMIGRSADRHIAADINLGGHLAVVSHTSHLLKAAAARSEDQRRAFNLLIAALAR
jgi:hypothetical protein